MAEPVVVRGRFNGPPDSAQGGYACGRFATAAREWLGPDRLVVTLHEPPPLDEPIRPEPAGRRVHFWHRERLIASVARGGGAIDPPAFAERDQVAVAEAAYVTAERHPFASCFVCGPARQDGLALAPGRFAPGMTGCRWTPDESLATGPGAGVPVDFAWAALDCPGGWTLDLAAAPMVLSRLSAEITEAPLAGTGYVVVGRCDAADARTLTTTTALYRCDGVLTGRALATWVRLEAGGG